MKYQPGDVVRFGAGRVDWEVEMFHDAIAGWSHAYYTLISGMSGRRVKAREEDIRPWRPHER